MNTSLSDRSIGFMLGVIHRRAVSVMTHRLKSYDITTEQWSVLLQIYMNEGLNQREIAVKAYKDQPTTTRILDMLEKKNLIIRKPSQKDRRAFELFLTDLGRDLSGTLVPLENKFNEEIAQIIPKEEMDVFWKVLSEMGSYLDTLLEKEPQTK
ncbi:MarR family winged helix-turn-helix transcriptional regulator [Paenibacillus sp. PDC88]|uniref:MarR family winged helix-turn-helix transcriptional regulator n=1 Tax=Paenibacillus sp. PDC88 TaxID=1884375 RepID=UPI000897C9ED|nr:MarR family transcriptional regulator [Paenibacillus sp. PDC88]SDW18565.1 DNA-binding transcriptional regulator, MarR family [Paenibacillus sp. PDC88]